ncbi:MAG TPA: hypothetical protein VN779_23780 [Actinocrinis sp.]|nr:hypothetical protein [Actinocrinis sp.]HXR73827.1 hypothetical protein [Actinocrinis sp.]
MLTERLNHLMDHGIVERRPYDRRRDTNTALPARGADARG